MDHNSEVKLESLLMRARAFLRTHHHRVEACALDQELAEFIAIEFGLVDWLPGASVGTHLSVEHLHHPEITVEVNGRNTVVESLLRWALGKKEGSVQ